MTYPKAPSVREIKNAVELARLAKLEADMRRCAADVAALKAEKREAACP